MSVLWICIICTHTYINIKVRVRISHGWLPHVRGQGQKPGGLHAQEEAAKRSYPASEVRGSDREELPMPEARGGGWEEQPHLQGVVAAWAQEGLEELFYVQGQKGWR